MSLLVIVFFTKLILLVVLQSVLGEELAVWVWQELVLLEGERDAVLLDPGLLSLQGVPVVAAWVGLELAQVVAELVVGNDEGILMLGILNAVGVIVILGRS